MEELKLKGEFIQLNQLFKAMGWAMTGGEAHMYIDEGEVSVNGAVEYRRRNKLYKGFEIEFQGKKVKLV